MIVASNRLVPSADVLLVVEQPDQQIARNAPNSPQPKRVLNFVSRVDEFMVSNAPANSMFGTKHLPKGQIALACPVP